MKILRMTMLVLFLVIVSTGQAWANQTEVKITKTIPSISIDYQGENVRVMRIQDTNHTITGGFAKTSRKCPPFCFQPMEVAAGVRTVGEIEVIYFMLDQYKSGSGLIIDSRVPSWHKKGTIPGSVNVPFTVFDKEKGDPAQLDEAMRLFGVKPVKGGSGGSFWDDLFGDSKVKGNWDFSDAKELLLYCNGAWCGQSPTAIRGLLALGYPPEKINYYRGGMQMWQLGGFSTIVPED